MVLDEIDKKILNTLQEDARKSYRKIADELGVSEATIHVRVKKLINAGVIKGFSAIVNPDLVGKDLTAFVHVKSSPGKYEVVLEALTNIEDIYEIHDVTGEYYTILKIKTGSREEIARVLDRIGSIEGIMSTETSIVLRTTKEETRIKL